MIKKTKKGYRVVSHKGKNLGDTKTKSEAMDRMAEVEMFKHMDKDKPSMLGKRRY